MRSFDKRLATLTITCLVFMCASAVVCADGANIIVETLLIPSSENPRLTLGGTRYAPVTPPPGPKLEPVVLWHGVAGRHVSFDTFARALATGGYAGAVERVKIDVNKLIDGKKRDLEQLLLTEEITPNDPKVTGTIEELNILQENLLGVDAIAQGREVYAFDFRNTPGSGSLTQIGDAKDIDYSFRNLIEDFTTGVDYVAERTQSKVIVVGYSKGGMVANEYKSGTALDYDTMIDVSRSPHGVPFAKRSEKKISQKQTIQVPAFVTDQDRRDRVRAERANKIAAVITLGAPVGFENISSENKVVSAIVRTLRAFDLLPNDLNPRGEIMAHGHKIVSKTLPKSVANPKNLPPLRLKQFLKEGLTKIKSILGLDFVHWAYTGIYEDPYTGYLYGVAHPNDTVPSLAVVGTWDGEAPAADTILKVIGKPPKNQTWIVVRNRMSHLEINQFEYSLRSLSWLYKLALDPKLLGPERGISFVYEDGTVIQLPPFQNTCQLRDIVRLIEGMSSLAPSH